MLVLSRKIGESIIIADNIEVIVVEVEGENVRLGIRAPREVGVHRKEVYLTIQESNKEATLHPGDGQLLHELMKDYLRNNNKPSDK
jgi:carbon storage regulator